MNRKIGMSEYGAPIPPYFGATITLCGSTRFKRLFHEWNARLTMSGWIVLSVGFFTHTDKKVDVTMEEKAKLDILHLRKISKSEAVLVLDGKLMSNDQNGYVNYIGESTAREIEYAKTTQLVSTLGATPMLIYYLSLLCPEWNDSDFRFA